MSLKKKKNRRVSLVESNVNITALLDVLTVLLFFLIKSSSVTTLTLSPPDEIRLPASIATSEAEESVRVSLSKTKLIADNDLVIKLQNQKFAPQEIGPDSRTIVKLQSYLTKQLEKKKALFKGIGDINELPPNKIIIQTDKELPFGLIKYLLHTAAISGYSDYEFVIIPE